MSDTYRDPEVGDTTFEETNKTVEAEDLLAEAGIPLSDDPDIRADQLAHPLDYIANAQQPSSEPVALVPLGETTVVEFYVGDVLVEVLARLTLVSQDADVNAILAQVEEE